MLSFQNVETSEAYENFARKEQGRFGHFVTGLEMSLWKTSQIAEVGGWKGEGLEGRSRAVLQTS